MSGSFHFTDLADLLSKSRLDPSELTVNVKYDIEQYTKHIWYDHNYSFATGPSSQHC